MNGLAVACLVRTFPRLSQTFILDELLRLEGLGLDLRVYTLAASDDALVHDDVRALRAPVVCLGTAGWRDHLRVALRSPRRYVAVLVEVARARDHEGGYHVASRWRCFGQAVALSRRLVGVRHLHAHFAHDPAFVGSLAHRATGVPFTFTAHARDVHQVLPGALARRAAAADTVVACCEANGVALERLAPGKVRAIPHGVDLDRFRPSRSHAGNPPVILTVARLVEKKGLFDLVAALAAVARDGADFRWVVVGDGPLRSPLERSVAESRLGDRTSFLGARTRDGVLDAYRSADVFALTPVLGGDGDVDGIPNVIVEAMACGLPVVATSAGGVREAVTDGVDGLVVGPGDVDAIAAAIRRALHDRELRGRLGAAARRAAEERFDGRQAAHALAGLFATTTAM